MLSNYETVKKIENNNERGTKSSKTKKKQWRIIFISGQSKTVEDTVSKDTFVQFLGYVRKCWSFAKCIIFFKMCVFLLDNMFNILLDMFFLDKSPGQRAR